MIVPAAIRGSWAPRPANAGINDASIADRPRETLSCRSALWLASMNKMSRAAVNVRLVSVVWSSSLQSASTSSSAERGERASTTSGISRCAIQSTVPDNSAARVR